MPTYEYRCDTVECANEWEEFLKMSDPNPVECPKCHGKELTKLISGGSGKGKVLLSGQDLVDKNNADAKQLAKDVYANENLYANVLGEDRYEQKQRSIDKARKDWRR